ncbi:hypothetical protein WMZ97_08985 [Lentibacillus sp. N15]
MEENGLRRAAAVPKRARTDSKRARAGLKRAIASPKRARCRGFQNESISLF